MKKYGKWFLAALLLLAVLCLPLTAGAAKYIDSGFSFYVGLGDVLMPDYPDLAHLIGEGLTKDDFIINYSHVEGIDQSARYFDETGLVTMDTTGSVPYTVNFYITYTPKVQGVGKKTVFTAKMHVRKALTSFSAFPSEITMSVDETTTARIYYNSGAPDVMSIISYDSNVIDAKFDASKTGVINITPVGIGETEIVVKAYNDTTVTIPVTVKCPPTELTFAQDEFVTTLGETIDLGLSYGEGGMHRDPSVGVTDHIGNYETAKEFFPKDWSHFYAKELGVYRISMSTYNGHKAKTKVSVYSPGKAIRMAVNTDVVIVGETVSVYAYDENGKGVYLPMKITQGADIASINDAHYLVFSAAGTAVVTVTNHDGSTVDLTVEAVARPTEMSFNVDKLVMEVGDVFDLDIVYDQGYAPYTWQSTYYDWYELPSYMYPVSITEDLVVTAMAPGTMHISAYALGNAVNTEIYITVVDNEKALKFVKPHNNLGLGESFQLRVEDGYGKFYPATYSNDIRGYTYATADADGLVTGNRIGENWIYAKLADGRELRLTVKVVNKPQWLAHEDLVIRLDKSATMFFDSDQGSVGMDMLDISIEDESILKLHNDGRTLLTRNLGVTKVTAKAKYSDASVTFLVEVIPEEALHIANASMDVPYGFSAYLPKVTDANGKEVKIKWAITYEVPGEGNPSSSGIVLEEDAVTCTWPTASCILTGTASNGATVKLTVNGYKLPETIRVEPDQIWLELGKSQTVKAVTDEADSKIKTVYWLAEDEGIVSFSETSGSKGTTFKAVAVGNTRVAAMLDNGVYAMCTVTVYDPNGRKPGDANEDGKVDIHDALLVMQYDAGWNVKLNGYAADVNADGRVNNQDGLLIIQACAGLDVELKQYVPKQ